MSSLSLFGSSLKIANWGQNGITATHFILIYYHRDRFNIIGIEFILEGQILNKLSRIWNTFLLCYNIMAFILKFLMSNDAINGISCY